jgi:mono/diheme cytochrome c family protein
MTPSQLVAASVIGVALCAASPARAAAAQAKGSSPAAPVPSISAGAVIGQYCTSCHSTRTHAGGLVLEKQDPARADQAPELWEKVVRKLRAGVMPPVGQPRPDRATYDALARTLEDALDRAGTMAVNPGRVDTFHRLNRAEYRNAIRDLLALNIDVESMLPSDDASFGFDNMAGVLKLNQSVLERYLAAAAKISQLAIHPSAAPVAETYKVSPERSQNDRLDGLPFGTRGGVLIEHQFPQDGEYGVKILMLCTTETDVPCNGALGFSEPHVLEVMLDGERISTFTLEPVKRDYRASDAGVSQSYGFEVRMPVKAGAHELGVTFVKTVPSVEYVRNGYRMRFERPYRFNADVMSIAVPFVETVVVTGPFNAIGLGETPSRRRIFSCRPATASEEPACARRILFTLADRAYRRPPSEAELGELLQFFERGRRDGGFETGIEMAVRRLLVSLNFLFRIELDSPASAGPNYRIADVDLASRLSFFLWSSIPDDELRALAARGTLHQPHVLEGQVLRMLADERASAFVQNFTGQWLQLRNLANVRPSEALFPDFDEGLRAALRRETELFVESIMREDRSVVELLTADYTFLNDRLARHYGIPNVKGPEFRRVRLADERRRGLLGHGSVLTVTSPAIRTSPVQRGKWILENILGSPPPPPPPDVPMLTEPPPGSKTGATPMRERMAQHRANPVCASCHGVIDPAGFALENYNWVGQWRDVDETYARIDASGRLPDGTTFSDLDGFRGALVANRQRFVQTLIEKLMTYALGRGVEYYDMPAVRKIQRDAAATDYRLSSLIKGIVSSAPFQMRRSQS